VIDRRQVRFDNLSVPVYSLNTVIVGTGAAGLNCAVRLFRELEETGTADPRAHVALVTRGVGLGTSHNAGSDKQTYYKLGTGGDPDTPREFAETLTAAGCAHGDLALIEGANSLRSFHHLVDAGVPFPQNERGGFVGYKTDHDPRQRATSAGPRTSRFMVQKLLGELRRYGITVFDRHHVLALVRGPDGACGVLCADMGRQDEDDHGLVLFNCRNVVAAGGGPGDLYEISVYPRGQMGPYAALFEAGAQAENLTELQFGLASLDPRWNLSGTYQQVIPRYFSTGPDGGDVRECLNPWFEAMSVLATDIFLKGYQWPFDHDRTASYGSSLIDVLVQNETVNRGRRVFMDFTRNPVATDRLDEFRLEDLAPEALDYLRKSGALQRTPIERLAQMNRPGIDLYAEMGTDIAREPLAVGVCAQHCNGGFSVDAWWESTVPHLFVIGELAGTHGVKRPGGSALNAGQVGGLRAAQRIAHVYYRDARPADEFADLARPALERFRAFARTVKDPAGEALRSVEVKREIQRRMSRHAGMVRSLDGLATAINQARRQWRALGRLGLRQDGPGWLDAAAVREIALAQLAFLEAMKALLERGGGSRGSHLVTHPGGTLPHPDLGDEWRYLPENVKLRDEVLTVRYDPDADAFLTDTCRPRPIPAGEYWFENTWSEFRSARIYACREGDRPRPYTTGS